MTFANPVFVYALLLLPAVGLFLVWAKRRRDRDLARLGDPALVQRLSEGVNWQGRRWKDVLRLAVLAALLVALARPLWGTVTETVEQEGVEVMVALDVSRSMLAQDIKPDRLSRAKMEVADLMTRLNGDEIGLVLFSGASFIQFPLTSDYATARTFLDAARPEVISRPGTALGDAMLMKATPSRWPKRLLSRASWCIRSALDPPPVSRFPSTTAGAKSLAIRRMGTGRLCFRGSMPRCCSG
ncbi:MAG: VWA domain-containing protein [Anaerolineae bacterium]